MCKGSWGGTGRVAERPAVWCRVGMTAGRGKAPRPSSLLEPRDAAPTPKNRQGESWASHKREHTYLLLMRLLKNLK